MAAFGFRIFIFYVFNRRRVFVVLELASDGTFATSGRLESWHYLQVGIAGIDVDIAAHTAKDYRRDRVHAGSDWHQLGHLG